MSEPRFTLESTDSEARLGSYETVHGKFSTPMFMPVGTRGSVKGVDVERLSEIQTEVMLVNTYHLWLRPGEETVRKLGGIHAFTGWDGPILSDSGGFQVFSLKSIRSITEEGVDFRSHIDGSKQFLSPEKSVQIQEALGVDIAMVLDECPASDLSQSETEKSLDMTLRWAKRSLEARKNSHTSVFGITQGGLFSDLRTKSIQALSELDFDGFAVGGLSVGEPKEQMYEVLSYHVQDFPKDKIRYLMGVGTPQDIVEAVSRGIDLFDCVIPTRAGRFGRAYIGGDQPYINIKNSTHHAEKQPLDISCGCLACRKYSRGYIHHLFRVGEMLAPQLVSIHNLSHYLDLMRRIREAISNRTFLEFHASEMKRWEGVQ